MRIRVWSAVAAVLLLAACGGPEAGATRPQDKADVQARHQRHRDQRRRLRSGEQAGHRGDRRPPAVLGRAVPGALRRRVSTRSRAASSLSSRRRETCRRVRPMPGMSRATRSTARPRTSSHGTPRGCCPSCRAKYGDFVIPVVLAHEWGHAVQARSNFTARTVTKELQADCFAGAWSKHAQDDGVFDVNERRSRQRARGHPRSCATPRYQQNGSEDAHGSGFDRVGAFQDGYDNGLAKCKDYRDDDPIVLELPFSDAEDEARGGDAPYDSDRQRRALRPRGLLDAGLPGVDRRARPGRRSRGIEAFRPGQPADVRGPVR